MHGQQNIKINHCSLDYVSSYYYITLHSRPSTLEQQQKQNEAWFIATKKLLSFSFSGNIINTFTKSRHTISITFTVAIRVWRPSSLTGEGACHYQSHLWNYQANRCLKIAVYLTNHVFAYTL